MKNKKKKLSSLRSVLILLQQLQVRYQGKCTFGITQYAMGSIQIYVCLDSDNYRILDFHSYEGPDKWIEEYRMLLIYLNLDKL